MTGPRPAPGRPVLGGGGDFAVGLPVDPARRHRLAQQIGQPLPAPGPRQVAATCAGCGGDIWIGPAQLTLVTAGAATAACMPCAFDHAAALGVAPQLLVAENVPAGQAR